MKIKIPNMPTWKQISGDVDPGAYGAVLARSDGDALELINIQPVREHVGDGEAEEVGFPWWSIEGYFDLDDLDPTDPETQSALGSVGLDDDALEEMTPTVRALAIAEAKLLYGHADEGPAGWADDVVPDEVIWFSGEKAGPEYFEDEEEEFRIDILGEEDEDDD